MIDATTYVTLPIGTTVELYRDEKPRVGEVFYIRHIDTKLVVHVAKVKSVTEIKMKWYRVEATITK